MTLVTNADRISSVLVNQAPRQSPKDVTWGFTEVYFSEDRKEVGDANGGGRNLQESERLGEDVVDLFFNGAWCEDELLRDVPVEQAGGDAQAADA